MEKNHSNITSLPGVVRIQDEAREYQEKSFLPDVAGGEIVLGRGQGIKTHIDGVVPVNILPIPSKNT